MRASLERELGSESSIMLPDSLTSLAFFVEGGASFLATTSAVSTGLPPPRLADWVEEVRVVLGGAIVLAGGSTMKIRVRRNILPMMSRQLLWKARINFPLSYM
jgi:hypothetical protein